MLRDRRAVAVTAILVLATLSLTGCFSGDASEPVTKAGRAASALGERMRLQLLVYNIQYGGGPATDRVIRQVDADVVGVLESYNRLPEIARKTGYPYYNVSLQLLSKYPIHEPSGGDGLTNCGGWLALAPPRRSRNETSVEDTTSPLAFRIEGASSPRS